MDETNTASPIIIQNLNQKRAISSNHSCGPFAKDQEIRLPKDGVHKKRHVLNQRKREMLGGIIKLKVVIKDIYCIKRIKRS